MENRVSQTAIHNEELAVDDNDAKEKHRLDTLHDEKLLRVRKPQEQEREHIAQLQAQERTHRELMLGYEHQLAHDTASNCQKALHEQNYEERKRILALERQCALPEGYRHDLHMNLNPEPCMFIL